ncbi:sigma-70 family RNA polymerase sigma factor [Sphingosinicella rhizophila]|uniref:Sigma-70 family RNA polymerase sigma factor n=1 Tax=Sphingosinicella rhizophila TaxID=3050082 RepID=A0ABU3Q751_9SPHN|nr:sigma-70 family RNA polymerase sigma factor [Sphingosinicella sp. GR2756]MDT9599238.1 sigma-70 family RNA polymerase sigma factor [Sphingosinicella sp. GR2756]
MDAAVSFEPLRPRLIRVAYRMLGSVADAEDMVQEAFLRWMGADRASVREPEAFLRRVVTRLCLDRLKSAAHRHETYVGPWLPEPIVETEEEQADDISLPLMLALERLSPLERAAFLLHDVFGVDFDEVADTIGRDPAACRQLASRARSHIRESRPRFPVARERGLEIASAFFAASRTGDLQGLRAMLADDVVMQSDGGGKRAAARWPFVGIDEILRVHKGLARLFAKGMSKVLHYGLINGLPGFVTLEADGELQTTALQIDGDRITAIYIVRNPDKLSRLGREMLH